VRRSTRAIAIAASAAAAAAAIERRFFAAPRYRGPISDHFDGHRFHNPDAGWQSEGDFLKWVLNRNRGYWVDSIDARYGPPPPKRAAAGELRVTFINHSTTLLQLDGMNILTDPVWAERVSPVPFTGPRRHRPPGIRFEDLPAIDMVLVSHNHYDHCDVATLRRLEGCKIITPLGNAALLKRHGISATELDWWQSDGSITAVPAHHFSARGLSDRNRNLWSGFVIASPAGNVYFSGDTGWGEHFAQIGQRNEPIRLALLPIGSYLPRWFMRYAHIDPAEAVRAHFALRAKTSVAIHFGAFELGDDGQFEPIHDLQKAVAANGNPRFWVLDHGEGRDIPPCD
jgi:L-ascorbate metabolism protein UlaG (beta-lactamase superfamily)